MKGFAKFANSCAELIYKWFGKDSGKMLLATSMIGISMSSAIQAIAVLLNDKYTMSQKSFMVPQELGDAMLSMISLVAITKPSQKLMSKLVKTGKIMPKNLLNYMKENKLIQNRGKLDFDFSSEVERFIQKIEKSDKYLKLAEKDRLSLTNPHKKALEDYETFKDSTAAIITTGAGIVSTCAVVPIMRNYIASNFQKKNIAYVNNKREIQDARVNPVFKSAYTPRYAMRI